MDTDALPDLFGPSTALIVVDMQHDFADPAGSLYVGGAEHMVGSVNELLAAAKAAGSKVVYTQDWHPESTPHFAKDGGIWPTHCVAGSPGAAFHPELVVAGPVVRKGVGGEDGYSGFTVRDPATGAEQATELEELLRADEISATVVIGLATDYCVVETALDSARLGFDTALVADAVRAVNLQPGDGARAIARLVAAGVAVI